MKGSIVLKQQIFRSDMSLASSRQKPIRWLVHGPSGGGKTFSLRTLKDFGPIYHYDFDQGGSGLAHGDFSEGEFIQFTFGQDLTSPDAFDAANLLLEEQTKTAGDIGVLVIDTLTTLGMAAMNSVLQEAGRLGQQAHQNDYLPQMVRIENFILRATAMPVKYGTIVLAHDELEKDEETGRFIQKLSTTGKLSTRMLRFFGEIYHATREGEGDNAKYWWITRQNRSTIARTQLPGLDERILQDFGSILRAHGPEPEEESNA